MQRVVARMGVALIGVVSAAGGLMAAALAARTPALHSWPTLPLLGVVGLVVLPAAAVAACVAHRRGGPPADPPSAPTRDATPAQPEPEPPPAARRTEPPVQTRPSARAHRRRVRHAGR